MSGGENMSGFLTRRGLQYIEALITDMPFSTPTQSKPNVMYNCGMGPAGCGRLGLNADLHFQNLCTV